MTHTASSDEAANTRPEERRTADATVRRSRAPAANYTTPARSRWIRLRPYALPALTTLGLGLMRLTSGGYKVDTALYAGVAQRMIETGQWWTPSTGAVPYFNKPPLVMWSHGLFMSIAGADLWAIRLPQLFAAIGCILAGTHIARRLAGRSAALVAGMIVALSWPVAKHLNRLVLDYWTVLFILIGVACVVEAWSRSVRGPRPAPQTAGWMLAAGVSIGLATLCKPFFAFIALPILALWLILERQAKLAAWLTLAVVAALAVNLPWHLSMASIHGEVFTSQYLGREIVSRGVGQGGFGRNPFWWYFYFMTREWWPWLPVLVVALWAFLRGAHTHSTRPVRPALTFTAVWVGVWIVLLSAFADKRDRYMMHLWPALAFPCALYITRFAPARIRQGDSRAWTVLAALCMVGGLVGLTLGIVTHADRPDDDWAALMDRMHEIRAAEPGTAVYESFRHPPRGAKVYLTADIWPEPMFYGSPAVFREPPPGAVVLADYKDLTPIELDPHAESRFGKWRLLRYQPWMRTNFERWLGQP